MRRFPHRSRPQLPAAELVFITDFLAEFGREPDPQLYAAGGGNSFTEMCGGLLDDLAGTLPALDAVLLAYHLPDLQVAEVAGSYVAHRCPGNPTVFSVSGQGVGAPFTALRILDCMHRTGAVTDAGVIALDPSTVHYRDPDTHDRAVRDCAVLMRTESADHGYSDPGFVLDVLDEQPVADPAGPLVELVRRLPPHRIVVGRMLVDRLDPRLRARHGIIEAAPGDLCTAAWTALAEHWSPDRYTVVADYDPHAGRLFQAVLRPEASR